MAAREGQLGQMPRSPRRRLGEIGRAAWRAGRRASRVLVDLPLTYSGSDRGVEARARRRIRALGHGDAGISVESWRGEVTLRGTLGSEEAARVGAELARVRGVQYVNNFLRP